MVKDFVLVQVLAVLVAHSNMANLLVEAVVLGYWEVSILLLVVGLCSVGLLQGNSLSVENFPTVTEVVVPLLAIFSLLNLPCVLN